MSDHVSIGELAAELAELRAEYARVGKPILDRIVEADEKIRGLKRERGELFHIEYWHYGVLTTSEEDTLEDAASGANAIEDSGVGSVVRIYGPDVELKDGEWSVA